MSQLIRCAIATAFFLAVVPVPAIAQQDDVPITEKIRQAQTMIRSEFRQILRDEMMLNEDEKQAFWPLYERYSAEMRVINDRYLQIVAEYVERYYGADLSDDDAIRLMKKYFEVQIQIQQHRQKYFAEFTKIMSGIKATRLYQLENKVQAEVDAALAVAIPLADPR
ncbi:MAG: hypothetical protein KAJ57_12780 [Woeseiaceae bacterium]|nr:hypothetical protein [Woeseiaceae bacterium]